MGIYDSYNRLGKEYIKGTRQNFVERAGESGLKKIIKDIFIGKNIRDYTEFQTQSRLTLHSHIMGRPLMLISGSLVREILRLHSTK